MIAHQLSTLMKCTPTALAALGTTAAGVGSSNGGGGEMDMDDDTSPCSGRGDCLNGTCLCEIRYSGAECSGFNLPYHAGVSTVFYFVALFSIVQLLICIVAEYQRMKQPSLLAACRISTQKLLYFVVFLAATLRGAYFTTPEKLQPGWAANLVSAYYPLLMTCASLVVCLWAEIFHLRNIRASHFLSKSFLGFVAFNLLPYSLFGAEVLSSHLFPDRQSYAHIFTGCYAVLLLIVVIFFLIYGVEVFFKIRGEFTYDGLNGGGIGATGSGGVSGSSSVESMSMAAGAAVQVGVGGVAATDGEGINLAQVHHARFGLLSQAVMMIVIVGFLASETLGDLWKSKVPVYSRNWHDIVFRSVEVGVALWFPCCLWNSMKPEQLWILNPRRLLRRQIETVASGGAGANRPQAASAEEGQSFLVAKDCWICYDNDKCEPLIQPCRCTGDVSSVHHECLRRWLVESCSKSEEKLRCKVCDSPYEVERTNKLYWEKGFTINHWAKTFILITTMCITGACAWVIIQVYVDPIVRILTAGTAILIGYVCVKLLSENTVTAYQRAKVSSINIVAGDASTEKLQTICQDVQVD